jgi:hypothetical protein
MEIGLIVLIRMLVPLTIFRWPLAGGLLAIVADAMDYPIIARQDSVSWDTYQILDKGLDFFYLSIEAFVALSWKNSHIRNVATTLFLYRALGVILFEATKLRIVLFLFPNIFEYFYLFCLMYKKRYGREPRWAFNPMFYVLLAIVVLKVIQEFILHFGQYNYISWMKTIIGSL